MGRNRVKKGIYDELLFLSDEDILSAKQRRQRASQLKSSYGLTLSDYEALEVQQENCCAICKKMWHKRLHVDHCHVSLRVRGLLCNSCNMGLGAFKDSELFLLSAVEYLRRFKNETP